MGLLQFLFESFVQLLCVLNFQTSRETYQRNFILCKRGVRFSFKVIVSDKISVLLNITKNIMKDLRIGNLHGT